MSTVYKHVATTQSTFNKPFTGTVKPPLPYFAGPRNNTSVVIATHLVNVSRPSNSVQGFPNL